MPVVGHLPLADTAYLKLRCGKGRGGYRWYARVSVPRELQALLGRLTVERALNTSDFSEAKKLKHAVVAEIFADFERARRQTLTSADIEHEAQRYLRERLESIQRQPDHVLALIVDEHGTELDRTGEAALGLLYEMLEGEDWPLNTCEEAERAGRSYGVTLADPQRGELLARTERQSLPKQPALPIP